MENMLKTTKAAERFYQHPKFWVCGELLKSEQMNKAWKKMNTIVNLSTKLWILQRFDIVVDFYSSFLKEYCQHLGTRAHLKIQQQMSSAMS